MFTKGLFWDLATVDYAGELDLTPIKEIIPDWTFIELARDARKVPDLANAGMGLFAGQPEYLLMAKTGVFGRIDAGWRKRICLAEMSQ
ncbi:MAG: hypothetical protein BMS9Abin15_0501 [Gammaproteobacteria bacterium]|nr:MAG: hypothetical protein BMS9Abin15_0501 [Gammaproteobacteria bacterium]